VTNRPTIIFDLDGTLLDTLADIATAANRALQDLHCPPHSIESYRTLVGDGVTVLFQRALPPEVASNAVQVATAVARFKHHYEQLWDATSRPYDGIVELLDDLKARQAILTVLSNKPDAFTQACVARFFPADTFTAVLGSRDDFPCKPDPAGVTILLQEASLKLTSSSGKSVLAPNQCFYLGDTNTDMKTAVAAGCMPIGVTWGFRQAEELQAAGAKALIHHPSQLLPLLSP
jgi:phosphoglycolate phosphatase